MRAVTQEPSLRLALKQAVWVEPMCESPGWRPQARPWLEEPSSWHSGQM